jgi:hypothetical protein
MNVSTLTLDAQRGVLRYADATRDEELRGHFRLSPITWNDGAQTPVLWRKIGGRRWYQACDLVDVVSFVAVT